MTRATIYTVSNGKLSAMRPAAPENEDTMQRLVAEYPEIIADRDGGLLLIKREQPIGDGLGDGRWSLDHLFVTRDAVPVLVELKRAVDTRLRREVVGQMLDYAANGTAYWQAGTIAASFAETTLASGRVPEEVLSEFLGAAAEPTSFWQQVDANFLAGRVKLVFVADQVPRELARIVEFLNEQMKADVRAVELNWFEGDGVKAFVPRVIGESERAQAAKAAGALLPPLSRDEWIDKHLAPLGVATREAASRYVELVAETGGHAEVTRAQGSVIAVYDLPHRVLYPLGLTRYGTGRGQVALQLGYLKSHEPYTSDGARQALYDRVTELAGPLSTRSIGGSPAFEVEKLNDPAVYDGMRSLIAEVVSRVQDSARPNNAGLDEGSG